MDLAGLTPGICSESFPGAGESLTPASKHVSILPKCLGTTQNLGDSPITNYLRFRSEELHVFFYKKKRAAGGAVPTPLSFFYGKQNVSSVLSITFCSEGVRQKVWYLELSTGRDLSISGVGLCIFGIPRDVILV